MLQGGRWLSVPMQEMPDVHVSAVIIRPWWISMAVVVRYHFIDWMAIFIRNDVDMDEVLCAVVVVGDRVESGDRMAKSDGAWWSYGEFGWLRVG